MWTVWSDGSRVTCFTEIICIEIIMCSYFKHDFKQNYCHQKNLIVLKRLHYLRLYTRYINVCVLRRWVKGALIGHIKVAVTKIHCNKSRMEKCAEVKKLGDGGSYFSPPCIPVYSLCSQWRRKELLMLHYSFIINSLIINNSLSSLGDD